MESIGVVVPFFGDRSIWEAKAEHAAVSASAITQSSPAEEVAVSYHEDSLALARNKGAARLNTSWIIFLDADDELDPCYIEEMHRAILELGTHLPGAGLYWPSTIGVHADGHEDDAPVLMQPEVGTDGPGGLLRRNWMVIGTMVHSDLFSYVGGFREDLPILEDWDLWIRCCLAGAWPLPAEKAIYRVHVNPGGRNDPQIHGSYYTQIQQRYQAEWNTKCLP
jgi:glycosyltransferase involved in cell wall biosynthesis